MPANDKSDWQFEKSKQKTTTTKCGHRCLRSAFGKVRFLGHKSLLIYYKKLWQPGESIPEPLTLKAGVLPSELSCIAEM